MIKLFLSLIAGALLPLAFAPHEFYLLAFFSLGLLFFLWEKVSARQAFWRGFFYGIGYFGTGVSWIYISIHDYGNNNILSAGILTLLFVLTLSLFPALNGGILNRFFQSPLLINTSSIPQQNLQNRLNIRYLLAFCTLWPLFEWLRSGIFTGFPWLLLGCSQTTSPLRGFAPILGPYGLSFLILFASVLLVRLIKSSRKFLSLFLLGLVFMSGFLLNYVNYTTNKGSKIHVSLIQGNIPLTLKWSPDYALNSLALYQKLSAPHLQPHTLILWPETAVTLFPDQALPLLENFTQQAKKNQTAVITGIPLAVPALETDRNNKKTRYFNGAMMLGIGHGYYAKRHLVPFGEYTPLESLIGKILNFLNLPMSNFSPGPGRQPLMHAFNITIEPFICYEIAYSDLLRENQPEADLLITLSNDAWFDQSAALAQHRQIAQFAALITGRYMLAATNSGETAVINPDGKIQAKSRINITSVLNGSVYAREGQTPWVKGGNAPFILFSVLILIFSLKKPSQKYP